MNVAELKKPLDFGRVKKREGGRGKMLDYLETHDVIRRANDIFGHGQWGHEVVELVCLGEEPFTNRQNKEGVRVGYRCTVRVTVQDCEPTCGVGYGDAQEYNGSKITPHELAAKEAESDALKRALKNYGDQFGLVLYAKTEQERAALSEPKAGADEQAAIKLLVKTLDEADPQKQDWQAKAEGQAKRAFGHGLEAVTVPEAERIKNWLGAHLQKMQPQEQAA